MANYDADQLEQLWVQAGGDPSVAALMAAIALQQSGGNPSASNVTGHESSHGLWQINVDANANPQFAGQNLADPLTNARAAVALYKSDGTGPWSEVPANNSDPYGAATENPIITAWDAAGGAKGGQKAAQAALNAAQGGSAAPVGTVTPQVATTGASGATQQAPQSVPAPGGNAQGSQPGAASLADLDTLGLPKEAIPKSVTPYSGPGAYKGFDLQAISPNLRAEAKQAIDQYMSNPSLQASMYSDIEYNYGAESWAIADPEIRTLLVVGTILDWGKDPNLFIDQLNQTKWYKTQSDNQRSWEQLQANNPGQAKAAFQQAQARVVDMANQLGVALSAQQVAKITNLVVQNSVDDSGDYSETSFTDQQLASSVVADFNAKTFLNETTAQPISVNPQGETTVGLHGLQPITNMADANKIKKSGHDLWWYTADGQPVAVVNHPAPKGTTLYAEPAAFQAAGVQPTTGNAGPAPGTTGTSSGQPTGDAAELYNQFQQIARNYYLPLTSQQIAQQVANYMTSDTGESGFADSAVQGFTAYAKQQASTLYPALGNLINQGTDPYTGLAGYRTLIANFTGYQGDPDTIDLSSPQWSWILTGSNPTGSSTATTGTSSSTSSTSSNSSPSLPTYDAVQKYLMTQSAFQSTDTGKQMGWQIGSVILHNFGFQ